ncbi:MAG: hypothetical protein ACI841_005378 [Planctomycetota bacterium]|jgi:hypothetical protein
MMIEPEFEIGLVDDTPLPEPDEAELSEEEGVSETEEGAEEKEKEEEAKPAFIIEGARSARARCKTCRKKIDKGALRLGILVVGPYGPGHMWHHLNCAAGRLFDKVEEAYAVEAWKEAAEEVKVPTLDSLRLLKEKAVEKKAKAKRPPYAERAPSGRSSCKHCSETIEKDAWRIVMGREVQFGNQVRTQPINVLPAHVPEVLTEEDSVSKVDDFHQALEQNSKLEEADLAEVLAEIGPLE